MTIEELAFKNRRTLAYLNEKDLLDIIEFLQDDRKQWINQFSKTHNESIKIQEENQELKKQLEVGKEQYNDLVEEKENLQEQLSSNTLQLEEYKDKINWYENFEVNKTIDKLRLKHNTQQKEFIKWLEEPIKLIKRGNPTNISEYTSGKLSTLEEILKKYKEIIGDDKNGN